jgi:hypothetical protein
LLVAAGTKSEIESLASRALPAALQLRFAQNDSRPAPFPFREDMTVKRALLALLFFVALVAIWAGLCILSS